MARTMLKVDEGNLKQGVLALAIALVEVIEKALEGQAIRRIDAGDLTEAELNRLGEGLIDLEEAITQIKADYNITESVAELRRGLDVVVDDVVDKLVNPSRWTDGR